MNKPLCVLLTLLLLSPARVLAQTTDATVAGVVKRTNDAVVLIVTSDSFGKEISLGSGFIVSPDGRIVTNYHVIKGGHSAVAKLSNGASFPVEGLIASNTDKDLAILKVPGRNLPHLDLADTEKLQIGDHVVAIGSPLGLEGSVSDGIVSAVREEGGKKMDSNHRTSISRKQRWPPTGHEIQRGRRDYLGRELATRPEPQLRYTCGYRQICARYSP